MDKIMKTIQYEQDKATASGRDDVRCPKCRKCTLYTRISRAWRVKNLLLFLPLKRYICCRCRCQWKPHPTSGIVHSFLNSYHNDPFNDFSTVFGLQAGNVSVLDSKVTMKVYAVEILESVIFRLHARTGYKIGYDIRMLLPYKATAMDYKDATVRDILGEQLKGTPFSYRFKNNSLVIVKETEKLAAIK